MRTTDKLDEPRHGLLEPSWKLFHKVYQMKQGDIPLEPMDTSLYGFAALNTFQAVVPTYHMKLKFSIEPRVEAIGSDSIRVRSFHLSSPDLNLEYEIGHRFPSLTSGGCVVRHGHYKPYPVQSEYVARTVDSKKGFVPSLPDLETLQGTPQAPYCLLHPLSVPGTVWDEISMDFISHLPPIAATNHIFGLCFCHWQGTGITRSSITPSRCLHFIPSIVVPRLHCKDTPLGDTKITSLNELMSQRHAISKTLFHNLARARQRTIQQAIAKWMDGEFKKGSWDFLKLQPYRHIYVASTTSHKLGKLYFGPFRVLLCIGLVAYELELPRGGTNTPNLPCRTLKALLWRPHNPNMPTSYGPPQPSAALYS
ncbi:hypothetical protein Sango_0809600 [Sesamum angolense]|uniref:Tf2-1-like SH3-like domain-containing protein n=1 Tax=Sesamum angolense TaxID=2727404 RepID=A0AAE1X365_9LAMI|nr:hypothetical protein Sango_0809600 [Sesamum angolense]